MWVAIIVNRSRPSIVQLIVQLAVIKSLIPALGLALVLGPQAPPRGPDATDVPGDLVRIGEHRLFVGCTGPTGNGPAVLLEAGGGGSSVEWSMVREQLGPGVRTCAYDRAGLGRSDQGPAPRTMRQEVYELHALLDATKETSPYVMVGQSIGGLLVRLYADAYPGDVAGVVLVDPTHESGILGSGRYGGMVRLREKATGRPVPAPRLSQTDGSPGDPDVDYMAEEFQAMFLARQRVTQPLGQRPLIVLAAGKRSAPPPGVSQEQWTAIRDERDELVRDLAALSANSRFVRVDESGHAIHRDNPAVVAQAIRDVRDAASAVRASRRLRAERLPEALGGITIQRRRVLVAAAQPSVDHEHRDAVRHRPYESRLQERIVGAREAVALQRGERIDERPECRFRFRFEIGIALAGFDEPPEHHAVMRRMSDREAQVRGAHRLEARGPAPVLLPRLEQHLPQQAKALARHGGKQRFLVGEVAVQRRARHSQCGTDATQRQSVGTGRVDRPQRLLDQRPAQVAVMVLPGPLAARPSRLRRTHPSPS